MEEWRKGWHPEKIEQKGSSSKVLIIGSGPAGLEAALACSNRGYEVTLTESLDIIGGRVAKERKLPGLSAWGRVADYREYQLSQKSNVETYLQSELDANQILEFSFENVCIATGSKWRADGVSRQHVIPIPNNSNIKIFTPDDIMEGKLPNGKVVLYDDDHYYMGGVIAELLIQQGCEVTLVTPCAFVSEWSKNTLEQGEIQKRLIEMGVTLELNKGVIRIDSFGVATNCIYSQKEEKLEAESVVIVASRKPNDQLYEELKDKKNEWQEFGLKTVKLIGDANAPGPIAWATYAGHRYARELDTKNIGDALPFRREITNLSSN
tara:strand:- start:1890 stop:2855 length:966 start_codon:yes stop_codon:yes gene_type:complete